MHTVVLLAMNRFNLYLPLNPETRDQFCPLCDDEICKVCSDKIHKIAQILFYNLLEEPSDGWKTPVNQLRKLPRIERQLLTYVFVQVLNIDPRDIEYIKARMRDIIIGLNFIFNSPGDRKTY